MYSCNGCDLHRAPSILENVFQKLSLGKIPHGILLKCYHTCEGLVPLTRRLFFRCEDDSAVAAVLIVSPSECLIYRGFA